MQKNIDYELICIHNNIDAKKNSRKKRLVSRVMFDSDIRYSLDKIDLFTKDINKSSLPINSQLYIYDTKNDKVLLPVSGLMSSDIKVLESVINTTNKGLSPRTDSMWRDSFNSVLINDLVQSKGTFINYLKNEKFSSSPLDTKNKIAYFYGDLSIDPLLSFPYMPKQGNKLNHSHFDYNANTNKFYIADVNPNIINYDEHIKNMNDKIEALANWYSDYRNIRNYYLFRKTYFDWKRKGYGEFEKEETLEDVKLIKTEMKKHPDVIHYNQISLFDLDTDIQQKKEEYLKEMKLNDYNLTEEEKAVKKAVTRSEESKEEFDHLDEYVEEERANIESKTYEDSEVIAPRYTDDEEAVKEANRRNGESAEEFDHLDEYVEEERKIKAKGR